MKKLLFLLLVFAASNALATVTVKMASPAANSTVGGSFSLQASASSSHPIVGWHAYLDSKNVYTAGVTQTASSTIYAGAGHHQLVVRAWDSTGAYGDQTISINVGSGSPTTNPPNPTNTQFAVSLASPAANSTVGGSFSLQASASGPHPIVGWHAYLDSKNVLTAGVTGSVNGTINAGAGHHQLVVRAWDSTGAYADQTVNITVGSGAPAPPPSGGSPGAGLPTPPSNAIVYSNIDQMSSGWVPCGDPACAGGNGGGNYWQAFFQTTPSMDGASMELYRDGVWANALWHHKMGAHNNVTNLMLDFYLMVDDNSLQFTQALEVEAFQFVGGYNYMLGTQCDYGLGVWDTWSEASGHWLPTNIPCPKFTPNQWHHVQEYITTNHSNHSYTYHTFVIDGKAYTLNQTQYAKYLAWGDNVGAQWQLDENAKGGGYHEWIDKAKLTIW